MNNKSDFQNLWNDYLEGEITAEGMTDLQNHLASDDQLLQDSVDSFQIHRLLGFNGQESEHQHESFVKSTMSKLAAQQATSVKDGSGRSHPSPSNRYDPPADMLTRSHLLMIMAVAAVVLFALTYFSFPKVRTSQVIAKTTNVHGVIEWTYENGLVEVITTTDQPLTGGTLETMTGDATVTLQFADGTIVTLDGLSLLTISEQDQKILRLKRGNISADVQPQPDSKPMLVYTAAAELQVIGTQFNVNARDESTKLTVNEGEVLLKRTTDGESVNVVPHHQVVASLRDAKQLTSVKRADQIHSWKSDLQSETSYGKWIPSWTELAGKLKLAVANGEMSQMEAVKTYKKAASLNDQQGSVWALPSRFGLSVVVSVNQQATIPVVLERNARIRITGRGYSATNLVVGITTNQPDGGFSGKYEREIDPTESINPETQEFTIEFPIETMIRSDNDFPVSPIGREFVGCWCSHPTNKVTKLEITSIEIIDAK